MAASLKLICRPVDHAARTTPLILVRACGVPTSNLEQPSVILKRKATPSFPHFALLRVDAAGRGSDGRFGLRRFRAKHKPTAFGTHRAFTHSLPPSFRLRSVPSPVSVCFFSLPLK